MSNTATFTIDEAYVTPGEDVADCTEEQVAVGVRAGVAEIRVPLQRAEFSDEQAQAIAEALQGQQITGTIRSGEEPQTGPDGEAYYMGALRNAVLTAVSEQIARLTDDQKKIGEQA